MVFLKEDGCLDIDRINALPFEEYMDMMGDLTEEQIDEYMSKVPLVESHEPYTGVWVDYTLEEERKRGSVDAREFLNNLKEELWKK